MVPDFLTSTVKYYSFRIGEPGTPMSSWILYDIKVPAFTARQAIVLHWLMVQYKQHYAEAWISNKHIFYEPSLYMVKSYYRSVLEFEKKERSKPFRADYKRIGYYSQHVIKSWFKK